MIASRSHKALRIFHAMRREQHRGPAILPITRQGHKIPKIFRILEQGEPSCSARATLPTLTAIKVVLYRGMREQGIGKAELARRLGLRACNIAECPSTVIGIPDPRTSFAARLLGRSGAGCSRPVIRSGASQVGYRHRPRCRCARYGAQTPPLSTSTAARIVAEGHRSDARIMG